MIAANLEECLVKLATARQALKEAEEEKQRISRILWKAQSDSNVADNKVKEATNTVKHAQAVVDQMIRVVTAPDQLEIIPVKGSDTQIQGELFHDVFGKKS